MGSFKKSQGTKQRRKGPCVPQMKLAGLFILKKIYYDFSIGKNLRRENHLKRRK